LPPFWTVRIRGFFLLEFLLAISLLGAVLAIGQRVLLVTTGSFLREMTTIDHSLARARLLRLLEEDLACVSPEQVQSQRPGTYRWQTAAGMRTYFFDHATHRLHRWFGETESSDGTVLLERVETFALQSGDDGWLLFLQLAGEARPTPSVLPQVLPNFEKTGQMAADRSQNSL
jgi:hypothetical protein